MVDKNHSQRQFRWQQTETLMSC